MRPIVLLRPTLALVCLAACTSPTVVDTSSTTLVDDDGNDDVDDDTDDTDDSDGDTDGDTDDIPAFEKVSILLVIDNSGSMGDEQAQVTTGIASLISALDGAGLDWRIGVTTTDNGNPWCPAGTTTPENGELVMSSCRQRLNDFLFSDSVDVQDIACNDICALQEFEVTPSTTLSDDESKPRPWLERTGGVSNVAEPYLDVVRCMLPQGVNGCGFESQLEAAYRSVVLSGTAGEPNYGFFEEGRLPVLVFLTDEVDCSHNSAWSDIFAADGNKAFWSDPSSQFPTSAVCWNAGVECTGDPSGYDSCEPVNKDINGNSDVSATDAVLYPVSGYIDRYAMMGAVVYGIVGVDDSGEPFYADTIDPSFQASFGIGPGCTGSADVTAVPPVRIRAVAEANAPAEGRKLYSVCASDYEPTFADIGQSIVAQL
jgi:hypothetical protein